MEGLIPIKVIVSIAIKTHYFYLTVVALLESREENYTYLCLY